MASPGAPAGFKYPIDWYVLEALRARGPMTADWLAARLSADDAAVIAALDRLWRRRLIRRVGARRAWRGGGSGHASRWQAASPAATGGCGTRRAG